jgi:hypothetical protein
MSSDAFRSFVRLPWSAACVATAVVVVVGGSADVLLDVGMSASAAMPTLVVAQDASPKEPSKPGQADTTGSPSGSPPVSPPPEKAPPRSLDDLLGVPAGAEGKSPTESAEDAARREQEKRLERSLNEASMQDLVQRAMDGMKTAAERLTDAKDPGLGTQRVQEDVVRTLDRLLEEAQKRQGKKSSSSKSGSKKKQPSKQNDGKQDPSEQNGQQQRQNSRSASSQSDASDPGDGEKSETRDDGVAETSELAETRIEWGQLPERVRELVLQGRRDRVSTIYERLTREYYRRLAEEASR